jgi:hypothetical protein
VVKNEMKQDQSHSANVALLLAQSVTPMHKELATLTSCCTKFTCNLTVWTHTIFI